MREPIQMPTPGSDAYDSAHILGKLQREIGEVVVGADGIEAAKETLAAAKQQNE